MTSKPFTSKAIPNAFEQAASLLQANRVVEAEHAFRQVLQAQPANIEAAHYLAVCLSRRCEYGEAIRYYEMALAASPNHVGARINYANALQGLGRFAEALACYDRAIASGSNSAALHCNRGNALKELRRFDEALLSYRRAIAIAPDHINSYYNRGTALIDLMRYEEALRDFDLVLSAVPGHAPAYCNRGIALFKLKRYADANQDFERAISLDPTDATVLSCRGSALLELRRYDEALTSCDRAIALKPDLAEAYSSRGSVLRELKRYEEALASCDRAIALKPDLAEAYSDRSSVLEELKRYDEALANCDRAIALKPDLAEAHSNRGSVLRKLKRYDEALASCDRAIALKPDLAEAHSNRGSVLRDLKRYDEALASCDRAIAIKPNLAGAYSNRACAFLELRRFEDALLSSDQAIAIDPILAEAYFVRGEALRELNRSDEAAEGYCSAIAIKPDLPYLLGCWHWVKMLLCDWAGISESADKAIRAVENGEPLIQPFALLAIPSSPRHQQQCARIFALDKFPAGSEPLWQGQRYQHDRIRIGYFSADFRDHPVAQLITEFLERHDRSRFELIAFSLGRDTRDPWRQRLENAFDQFFNVEEQTDQEIAELARQMEIDIAVDLMGFTQFSRMGVFALRLAPIQVNYLGYPGTLGADYMDYIMADAVVIPAEQRSYYTERVVWLPDSYFPSDTTKEISERQFSRAELGLPEDGFVFCSFCNAYKITPDIFEIWMRLLNKIEGSVLWLNVRDQTAIKNLRAQASLHDVAPERLVFAERMELADHFARHRQADLFLDTFHYNAHTTASDALWAGLPVVTCLGNTFAGRVAASLLHAVGLPELVTHSHEEYEALALELATHPEKLASVRQRLTENPTAQPLFDTPRFTRHIETAYQMMIERHQAGLAPDHIVVEA